MARALYEYVVRRRGFYDHVVSGFSFKKNATEAMRRYIKEHPTGNLGARTRGWVRKHGRGQ